LRKFTRPLAKSYASSTCGKEEDGGDSQRATESELGRDTARERGRKKERGWRREREFAEDKRREKGEMRGRRGVGGRQRETDRKERMRVRTMCECVRAYVSVYVRA